MTADATAPLIADDDPTSLPLAGAGPFEVYIKVDSRGTAWFATSTTAAEYTQIQWQPDEGSSEATITFNFFGQNPIQELTDVTPGLSFGSVSNNQQVATCSARANTYHFNVTYTETEKNTRQTIDPIVIVTVPPTNPGPC